MASGSRATPAPPPPKAPGLFEQMGQTKGSAQRLVGAHIDLAKAEFSEIVDAAKQAAVFAGIAIGAGLVAGLLLVVGLPLFLGEALFGSMGWGILLGILLLMAIATAAVVAGLRPGVQAPIGRPLLVAAVIGILVGIVFGLSLTNRGWSALGDAIAPGLAADSRPLVVALATLAIVGAVLGLIGGMLSGAGGKGAMGGLVGGALAGVLLGFLTAYAAGPRVGAAIGLAAGLIAWIALMGGGVARGGFDGDAIKRRFWPDRTIDTAKETIEWARSRAPGSTTPTPGS